MSLSCGERTVVFNMKRIETLLKWNKSQNNIPMTTAFDDTCCVLVLIVYKIKINGYSYLTMLDNK